MVPDAATDCEGCVNLPQDDDANESNGWRTINPIHHVIGENITQSWVNGTMPQGNLCCMGWGTMELVSNAVYCRATSPDWRRGGIYGSDCTEPDDNPLCPSVSP